MNFPRQDNPLPKAACGGLTLREFAQQVEIAKQAKKPPDPDEGRISLEDYYRAHRYGSIKSPTPYRAGQPG